jgi:hypothetical protein
MKNGIYGFHFMGIYCEAKFKDDVVIDAYVDKYGSECKLENKWIFKSFDFVEVK